MNLPGRSSVTVDRQRTPDGRRLVVEREIAAPAGDCWDLLIDTTRWPEWGPSVEAVDCDRQYIEAGTTGRVQTVGGVWLPFEITACRDRRWTWRVARVPATGHRVRGEDPCQVGFELPLLAASYAVVCVRALDTLAAMATASAD
jgi:hypothetical protein